jgi:TRAP-type C4-dicarboxylate transport system substrate-binding protein
MLPRILLSLLLPLIFAGMAAAQQAPVHVRLSTQIPPGADHFLSMLHFKERVEAASGGSLVIDIYDTGKLFDSDRVAGAVNAGQVEMGQVNLTRFADIVPVADAFTLPFLFSDEAIEKASRRPGGEIRTLIEGAILEQAGARSLWWISEGPLVLLTKGEAVSAPGAMAGKSVRTSGPTTSATLEACGGKPVDVPATQQPEAYASGRVDIGMTSLNAVIARKLFTSMKTVTRTNHAIFTSVVAVNEKFWSSLSEKQRGVMLEAAAAADGESADRFAAFEEKAYRQLTEQEGVKVVTLSSNDLMAWRICSSDVLADFVIRAGQSGQKLMAAYARLMQDPCCNQRDKSASSTGSPR